MEFAAGTLQVLSLRVRVRFAAGTLQVLSLNPTLNLAMALTLTPNLIV